MVTTVQDITLQEQAEKAVGGVAELLRLFTLKRSRQDYLEAVVRFLRDWCACRCVGIRLLGVDGRVPYAAQVGFGRTFLQQEIECVFRPDGCACARILTGNPRPEDLRHRSRGGTFFCNEALRFATELGRMPRGSVPLACISAGYQSLAQTPIRYHGRTREEGKKIRPRDALLGILTLLRFALRRDACADPGADILDRLAAAHRFNAWMAETVAPFAGRRVLEIGAGIGNLSRKLAPGREFYVASDIDAEHLSRLAARLSHRPSVRTARVDLTRAEDFAPLRGLVDTVVCLNVVEHVEDDRLALRNLFDVLAPGGRAIILVPEGQRIYGELDRVLGHWRRYSQAELRQKMEHAGFEIEHLFGFNRVTRPGWWWNGRVLRRRTFSRLQLGIFDRLVWLWKRIDPWLPWRGVSLIAVGRKPDSSPGEDQTR